MAAMFRVNGMQRYADDLEKGSYTPELSDCELYCISRGIRVRFTLAEDTSPCMYDASEFGEDASTTHFACHYFRCSVN